MVIIIPREVDARYGRLLYWGLGSGNHGLGTGLDMDMDMDMGPAGDMHRIRMGRSFWENWKSLYGMA